jgi:hypothetical protein
MKFKLPPRLRQPFFDESGWRAPPKHDGHGIFESADDNLLGIIRDFPGVEVLSDELFWFRMPEGTTGISVEQQEFTADDNGYFRAPVNLAPAIILNITKGFEIVGREKPPVPPRTSGGSTVATEARATRKLQDIFRNDPDRRLTKAQCRSTLLKSEALGPRAFERVWVKATEQFPERRKPGRPKKSNRHAN